MPNKLTTFFLDTFKPEVSNGRKEILHQGWFYDVTDFIPKHPGGSVINFYTERGEDATQAIEQFHFRSAKKAELLLKSFKRRPAPPEEVGLSEGKRKRHQVLSEDFKVLFEKLKEEGFFEPSLRHVILRFLEAFALNLLALGLHLHVESIPAKILVSALSGMAMIRFAYIDHETGHCSLTGNKKYDKILQDIAFCGFLGGSAVWWNSQHNRHHAMPQRIEHDVDLASLPFAVYNESEVLTSQKKFNRFFVKHQGFLYWTVDLFLVSIAWKFYVHPRCQLRKKAYHEMLLNIPTFVFMYLIGAQWFFLSAYFLALILALNFALGHSHLEVTSKPTHWIEYSLTHTANLTHSMFLDWWMGYLNYQVEHHLFPAMPNFRQKEMAHRVQALADKHGLPYLHYSYPEACKLAMTNLYRVGKRLTDDGETLIMEKSEKMLK